MGCCASNTCKAASAPQQHRHSPAARSDASHQSKAAPPPQEETVKEVLSETPTQKPKIEEEKKKGSRAGLLRIQEEDESNADKKTPLMTAEVSEVSESLSECVSTVTEKRKDDDGEVRQRVDRPPANFRNRAFSGDKRERTTVPKSPVKRSQPSPGRGRSVPGRERRALATDGQKRETGESSWRKSPVPRTAERGAERTGVGQSPSGRKVGKSPGKSRSDLPEKTRKVEETNQDPKGPPRPPTTDESLENPLVSLECFIFL